MAQVLSATQLLQAFNDAGVTDQATATRLIRMMLRNLLKERSNYLLSKAASGTPLTQAEIDEMASNDAGVLNLTQLIG
jgi:hypothetical protein